MNNFKSIANPNPQSGSQKYRGVHDLGYSEFMKDRNLLDKITRFGRKVDYSNKEISNEGLMQDHLDRMRVNQIDKDLQREQKMIQDREFLDRISKIGNLEVTQKEFQRVLKKDNFLKANDEIKETKRKLKEMNRSQDMNRSNFQFPFRGSE